MENDFPKIEITKNGPYIVSGNVKVERWSMVPDDTGIPARWEKEDDLASEAPVYFCRCGNSKHKPFCDDTHLTVDFDGTDTASDKSYLEQAVTIEGPEITLTDARAFCASARFCTRAGGIRRLVQSSGDPAAKKLAIEEAMNCSSGRLVIWDKQTGNAIEPEFEPCITVAEDPAKKVSGPLYAKGGIALVSSEGRKYETRNRFTLCRCGKSMNKPFCDGAHIKAGFNDGARVINTKF